jgi:hypothetical protein
MKKEDFSLVEICETRPLTGVVYETVDSISSMDDLFQIFLTDIFIISKKYQFIVDSFRFLYQLLRYLRIMHDMAEFSLYIGEGLIIEGKLFDGSTELFDVRIVATGIVVSEFQATRPEVFIAFSVMVTDLTRSISSAGIHVSGCLRKFPPSLFW